MGVLARGNDEDLVLAGACPEEELPVVEARGEEGRAADEDARALEGLDARDLGESQV